MIDCPILVYIGGKMIERTNLTRFLGMYIDDRLNYSVHALQLSKRLARANGVMRKLAKFMPPLVL